MDDDGDINIDVPGTGDVPSGDDILTSAVDWITNHGTVTAAIVLAVVGVGLYQRHKILSAFLFGAVLVALFMSIK